MEALLRQFGSFRREAFRCEALDIYRTAGDWEDFQSYLSGGLLPSEESLRPWAHLVSQRTTEGCTFRRLRVLPADLSPYLRYEIEWGYVYSANAGEQISILTRESYLKQELASGWFPKKDFWLFDDCVVFEMDYDETGVYLSATQISTDPLLVSQYVSFKNKALSTALPLPELLARIRANSLTW